MITKFKSLQKNQGFIKYSKNISWLFFERILRITVGLFVSVWVAKYLGPKQFGFFSYTLSFVALFGFMVTISHTSIVVRELVKNPNHNDEIVSTAFWLKIMGAMLGVLITLAISINFTSNDRFVNILILIIASSNIFHSFNVVDDYFQSKVMNKFVVITNVISLFLSSVIKIILILNDAPLIAFVWVVFFDNFILASGFIYFYIKLNSKFKIKNLKFKSKTAILLLKDSWPLMISSAAILIHIKVDQVIIKEILGLEAVGQYAAAARVSEAWYFIPSVLTASFFPAIINAKKNNEDLYNSRLQKLYDIMVWVAIAIAIPMIFLSDWLIEILYGYQYSEAGNVLMIHIWAGVFVSLGLASNGWLICENLQKFLLVNTFIATITNIGLNYILIPKFGIVGAAWATIISYFLVGYLCLLIWKKTRINFINLTKSLFFITLFKEKYRWNIKEI
jgi:O-antigen/teichoic acid export membrane protein|tara:strand:+ start:198 stop:1544 length:1347 start_codon:yes stop_codon:yes gene_type:complete